MSYLDKKKNFNHEKNKADSCLNTKPNDIIKLKTYIPKRLDSLNYSSFHTLVIVSLGVTWILDGYEVSLLSVLSGVIKQIYNMNDKEIGFTGSVYLSGCVSGSLVFGYLASKLGRKKLFSITLGIYTFSILLTSISFNKYWFCFFRFITGVAVGGEYSAIFAAIDELLPPSVRGRADLIIDGTWHLGSCISAVVSYLTLTYFHYYSSLFIRFLFLIGAILAVPVIYFRKSVPESHRWLLLNGRAKEALKIVKEIEAKCGVYELNSEESEHILSKEYSNQETHNEITLLTILKTLVFKYPNRFFLGLVLMASQAFFYNGIFYTYTQVLQKFNNISKESVGLYLIPLSIASFIGPLAFGWLFDRWGRRKMIFTTFFSAGMLLLLAAHNFLYYSSSSFGFKVQQLLWFLTFLIASPAASSAHLTVSEIFPLEMRSQMLALFFSCGLGTGGVIAPFIFCSLINENNKYSIYYSYIISAGIMIFASFIGLNFDINAENKSLEEISESIEEETKQNEEI